MLSFKASPSKLRAAFALLSAFLMLYFSSCASNKNNSTNTPSTNSQQLFLPDSYVVDSNFYSNMNGSLMRFHQLVCGRFVQYQPNSNTGEQYELWRVNDGKDSVLVYHFPVGNPDKDGYWVYNCQVLTSLPNEPLHANFSKLELISRDTIILANYNKPESFNPKLSELTGNPKTVFNSINLKDLKAAPAQDIVYARQSPIRYHGEMAWYPDDSPENKGGFLATYFTLDAGKITFSTRQYSKESALIGRSLPIELRKINRTNPKFKPY